MQQPRRDFAKYTPVGGVTFTSTPYPVGSVRQTWVATRVAPELRTGDGLTRGPRAQGVQGVNGERVSRRAGRAGIGVVGWVGFCR